MGTSCEWWSASRVEAHSRSNLELSNNFETKDLVLKIKV